MKTTIGLAVIILIWIIFSYIINAITTINIAGVSALSYSTLGELGIAIQYTIKYIYEVGAVLITVLIGSVYPNGKVLAGILTILETLAIFMTIGVL